MFLRSIGCLLFSLIMITEQSVAMNHQMNTSMDSHESVEWKLIDQDWEDRILETTNALFLLKKTMLAASKFDLNPLRYSPDIRLDLIRYPDSMRSTLLEISNGKLLSMFQKSELFYFRGVSIISSCSFDYKSNSSLFGTNSFVHQASI